MKISFDFDNTLSRSDCQLLAANLKSFGHNICITTTRRTTGHGLMFDNTDLFEVADRIGIENITFTEGENKKDYLISQGVNLHVDDDRFELELLKDTSIIPVLVNSSFWIKKVLWLAEYDKVMK